MDTFTPTDNQNDVPPHLSELIPYRCPMCGTNRRFSTVRELRRHLQRDHTFDVGAQRSYSRTRVFDNMSTCPLGDSSITSAFPRASATRFMSTEALEPNSMLNNRNESQSTFKKLSIPPTSRVHNFVSNSSSITENNTHLNREERGGSPLLRSFKDETALLERELLKAKQIEMNNKALSIQDLLHSDIDNEFKQSLDSLNRNFALKTRVVPSYLPVSTSILTSNPLYMSRSNSFTCNQASVTRVATSLFPQYVDSRSQYDTMSRLPQENLSTHRGPFIHILSQYHDVTHDPYPTAAMNFMTSSVSSTRAQALPSVDSHSSRQSYIPTAATRLTDPSHRIGGHTEVKHNYTTATSSSLFEPSRLPSLTGHFPRLEYDRPPLLADQSVDANSPSTPESDEDDIEPDNNYVHGPLSFVPRLNLDESQDGISISTGSEISQQPAQTSPDIPFHLEPHPYQPSLGYNSSHKTIHEKLGHTESNHYQHLSRCENVRHPPSKTDEYTQTAIPTTALQSQFDASKISILEANDSQLSQTVQQGTGEKGRTLNPAQNIPSQTLHHGTAEKERPLNVALNSQQDQLNQALMQIDTMSSLHARLLDQSRILAEQTEETTETMQRLLDVKGKEIEDLTTRIEALKHEKNELEDSKSSLAETAEHSNTVVNSLREAVKKKEHDLHTTQVELQDLKKFIASATEKERAARTRLETFIEDLIRRTELAEGQLHQLQSQSSTSASVHSVHQVSRHPGNRRNDLLDTATLTEMKHQSKQGGPLDIVHSDVDAKGHSNVETKLRKGICEKASEVQTLVFDDNHAEPGDMTDHSLDLNKMEYSERQPLPPKITPKKPKRRHRAKQRADKDVPAWRSGISYLGQFEPFESSSLSSINSPHENTKLKAKSKSMSPGVYHNVSKDIHKSSTGAYKYSLSDTKCENKVAEPVAEYDDDPMSNRPLFYRYTRQYSISDDDVDYSFRVYLKDDSSAARGRQTDRQRTYIKSDAEKESSGKSKLVCQHKESDRVPIHPLLKYGASLVHSPRRCRAEKSKGPYESNNSQEQERKYIKPSPLVSNNDVNGSFEHRRPTSVGLSRHSSSSESDGIGGTGIKGQRNFIKPNHRKQIQQSSPMRRHGTVKHKSRVTQSPDMNKRRRERIGINTQKGRARKSRSLSPDTLLTHASKQKPFGEYGMDSGVLQNNLSDTNDTVTIGQSGGDLDRLLDDNGILWDDQNDTLPDVSDSELDRVSPSGSEAIATKTNVATTTNITKPQCISLSKVQPAQLPVVKLKSDSQTNDTNTSTKNINVMKQNVVENVNVGFTHPVSTATETKIPQSSPKKDISGNRRQSQVLNSDSKRFRPIISEIGEKGSISDTDLTSGGQEVHQYMSVSPSIDIQGLTGTHEYSVDESECQTNEGQCAVIPVSSVQETVERISDKYSMKRESKNNYLSSEVTRTGTINIDDRIHSINEKYKVKRAEIVKGKGLRGEHRNEDSPDNFWYRTCQPGSAFLNNNNNIKSDSSPICATELSRSRMSRNGTRTISGADIYNKKSSVQRPNDGNNGQHNIMHVTNPEVTHSQRNTNTQQIEIGSLPILDNAPSDLTCVKQDTGIHDKTNYSGHSATYDSDRSGILTNNEKVMLKQTTFATLEVSDVDTEHVLSNLDRTIDNHNAKISENSNGNNTNGDLKNGIDNELHNNKEKSNCIDSDNSGRLPSSSIPDNHTESTDHYDKIRDSDVDTESYRHLIESDIDEIDDQSKSNIFSISDEIGEHLDLNLRTEASVESSLDDTFLLEESRSQKRLSPRFTNTGIKDSMHKSNDNLTHNEITRYGPDSLINNHGPENDTSRDHFIDQSLSLQEDICAQSSFAAELQDNSLVNDDISLCSVSAHSPYNQEDIDIKDADTEAFATDFHHRMGSFRKEFNYDTLESDEGSLDLQSPHRRYTASSVSSQEMLDSVPSNRREETRRRRAALVTIFSYLDLVSLCHVSGVCREWRLVSRSPKLWTVVRMEHVPLSKQFLKFLSKRCSKLKKLEFKDLQPYDEGNSTMNNCSDEQFAKLRSGLEARLEQVLKKAESSLHTLTIVNCGPLLSSKCLWIASCCCRLLRHVTYISDCEPINAEVMWALGSGCRDLNTLRVHPLLPNCKPQVFSTRCAQMIGQCFQDLTILSFGGKHIELSALAYIVKRCQKLETMELHDMQYISCELTDACCHVGLHALKFIRFIGTPVPTGALILLRGHCPLLRSIDVQLKCSDHITEVSTGEMTRPDYIELVEGLTSLATQERFTSLLTLDLEDPPPPITPAPEVEKSFFQKWFGC